MFGNTLGWSISLAMVLLTAALLWWIETHSRAGRADAFGLDPANVVPLALPPATLVVPGMTDASVDAADLYRQLVDRVGRERERVEAFAAGRTIEGLPRVASALKPMVEARAAAPRAALFQRSPGELINYDNVQPRLATLELAGRAAIRLALLRQEDGPDEAKALLEAAFALGRHLFDERLTYAELDLGMRLMAESVAAMKRVAREAELDPAAALARLEQYDAERLRLAKERILPVAGRIRSLDPRVVSDNAGNVFHWANGAAAERVWRVEAILAVGRLRHYVGDAGRAGDRTAAERTLARLAADPATMADPALAAAVDAARSLTPEQFRLLR